MKKKYAYIIVGILLFGITTLGITFGYLSASKKQDLANSFTVGCLNIEIQNEGSAIDIPDAYAVTDLKGLDQDGYTFTIHNTCNKASYYQINLEELSDPSLATTLSADYLRVALSSDTFDNIITNLGENTEVTAKIKGAYKAYNLYNGSIGANATKSFVLKEWVEYNTTKEEGTNKQIKTKINVTAGENTSTDNISEIKFNNKTGTIYGTTSNIKYCTTENNKCNPDININASNNQITVAENKGLICASINDYKTVCSDPVETGITILAKLDGQEIEFPTQGSGKNPISVTCTNDVTGIFDFNNWEVEVDAIEEGTTTCTVEFEEFTPQPFNEYLTNNASKLGLVEEYGLRYEGTDTEVHNYVLFNDELWRVIGVLEVETESTKSNQNLVKLIRADALDGLAWGSNNTWENNYLQKSLNNGYLKKENGTCNIYGGSVTKTCNFSETGLSTGASEKIEAVKWNIGKTGYKTEAEAAYTKEIATKTTSYYKVGLMSASDYGYAVLDSSCNRTTNLSSYDTSSCAGSNWLKNIGLEWTITPDSYYEDNALFVGFSGRVDSGTPSYGVNARPSVYLKSNINVIGGSGAKNLPYIIN